MSREKSGGSMKKGELLFMREDIRKVAVVKRRNSFYDVFEKRSYEDNQKYKLVAGITKAVFSERK